MREVRKQTTSGSTAYPRTKVRRDTSMPPKRSHRRRHVGDGPARPARYGESWNALTPIPSGPRGGSPMIMPVAGPPASRGLVRCLGTLPAGGRPSMRGLKGMSGAPHPRSDVSRIRNSGSPKGREPQGDGAPVVVRGGESPSHGEGGQVDRSVKELGRRDAESRPPENPATGEPYARKPACTVRRGAVGKGIAAGCPSLLSHYGLTNSGTSRLPRRPPTLPEDWRGGRPERTGGLGDRAEGAARAGNAPGRTIPAGPRFPRKGRAAGRSGRPAGRR